MIDISLCATKDCPVRDRCCRATAAPELIHIYTKFKWKVAETIFNCDAFIPITDKLDD